MKIIELDITSIIPVGMPKDTAIGLAKNFDVVLRNADPMAKPKDLAEEIPRCINCREVRSLIESKIQLCLDEDIILRTRKKQFVTMFKHGEEKIFVKN